MSVILRNQHINEDLIGDFCARCRMLYLSLD
ncbi:hypothetical protein SAMN05421863_10983 [Nitrosomonas communis]|uniref:Uncharacterized protein n=1 Tax=Nitrosomonas communis TaxID=44574 RepID=A0A1I4W4C5_9PROT|nr:hypothetical protein SAMN05421863_10983 [Nitrosomonas communis]